MVLLLSHLIKAVAYQVWHLAFVCVHLIAHVFNDQQHRAVQLPQVPVKSLQAGSMHHCTVGQLPRITLNPSRKPSSQLQGPHRGQCDGVDN